AGEENVREPLVGNVRPGDKFVTGQRGAGIDAGGQLLLQGHRFGGGQVPGVEGGHLHGTKLAARRAAARESQVANAMPRFAPLTWGQLPSWLSGAWRRSRTCAGRRPWCRPP